MKLRCVVKFIDDSRIAALVQTPDGLRRVDHRWYTKESDSSLPDNWCESILQEAEFARTRQIGVDDIAP